MPVPKVFQSSVDPEKVSLSVRGILVGVIPLILIVAPWFGVDITKEMLEAFAASIGQVAFYGAALVSSAMVAWGLFRKVLVAFGIVKPKA